METQRAIQKEAMESITERLSSIDDLYFPRALQSSALTPSHRKSLLLDLVSRDVPVFLERYGSKLTSEELREFETLSDDYEVNWHLKDLRKKLNPTSEELRSRTVVVRNRRLAYLNKLISDGQYFSEDAMREREPYLHHEYVGKFQDLIGRCMARPGERWSDTLMRRSEEAWLVAKIREEQQRFGVAQRDWIGNETNLKEEEEETEGEEEEQEEEEEEEEEGEEEEEEEEEEEIEAKEATAVLISKEMRLDDTEAANGARLITEEQTKEHSLTPEDRQDMMEQFTYIMQQKVLSGEDSQYLDYSKIDNDETLDDHWVREVNHDAEDKYFAED